MYVDSVVERTVLCDDDDEASPMQRSPGMSGLGGNQSLVDLNTEKI